MKIITQGDKILIGILIVASIFSIFYIAESTTIGSSAMVSVQVDRKEVTKIHLNPEGI